MTLRQSTQVVADLETASKNEALQLKERETELAEALQSTRSFGSQRGSIAAWNADWNRQWDDIGGILRRISAQVDAMTSSLDSTTSGNLQNAIKTWETVQSGDARLLEALKAIRTQVGELGAEERKKWNIIARTIESHMATTHECAESLRLKLVALKKHSDEPPEDLSTGAPSKPSTPPVLSEQRANLTTANTAKRPSNSKRNSIGFPVLRTSSKAYGCGPKRPTNAYARTGR